MDAMTIVGIVIVVGAILMGMKKRKEKDQEKK